ncbi:hypothetical protein HaLaN_14901 [Haematococcus lacustris]|uniref:Secreted protein n=1 Tax=Haematococcus lacustris TaxID=44745 RepID=A0A699Z9Q0_HAELA|nr:hypothetical protein HaLaN_14901 [Haematococcus lacustris]
MAVAAGLAALGCGCLRCCLIWAACGAEDLGRPAQHSHACITLHEGCYVSQELVVRELVFKPLNPFSPKAGCKLSLLAPRQPPGVPCAPERVAASATRPR